MQITLRPADEVPPASAKGSRHFGVTWGTTSSGTDRSPARARGRLGRPGLDGDAGLATEQTKAKIADPSGNVVEIKTYRDVDATLEVSVHSYPEAFARGN